MSANEVGRVVQQSKSFGIKVLLKSVTVRMSNNISDACFSKVVADECLWEKT